MKPTSIPDAPLAWQQLLEEADLCADHAQSAANCGRFCAACGLLMTASALCNRALQSPDVRCFASEVEGAVARRLGFYQDEVDKLLEAAVTRRLEKNGGLDAN